MRKSFFIVAFALAALVLVRVATMVVVPPFEPSEARYAAISANMARKGDWFVPRFTYNGEYQTDAPHVCCVSGALLLYATRDTSEYPAIAFLLAIGMVIKGPVALAQFGLPVLADEPVYVSAHKGRLQQMLGNLLDNALKFTPKGGKVEVRLCGSPFSLSVANTGPGIPAKDLPHIFKRFWRGDASRSLPGNGLGLALVKAIVSTYGGSVTCESTPGEWTVFTVAGLPLLS